jgi:hypothetical protein
MAFHPVFRFCRLSASFAARTKLVMSKRLASRILAAGYVPQFDRTPF